ncbi:MAG: SH3 domain-containing protein, partial [Rivularia sp. (in: cyanobacteria)]
CPQNVDGLNMRKQAGLNTEIITLIPCNATGIKDKKQRFDRDGIEWYLIEYQDSVGWVASKYLKQQANNPNKTIKYFKLVAKKKTLI